jgi:hypothetical protein
MGPDAINPPDDAFRSPKQVRLESAKLTFAKGYQSLNRNFICLITIQTIRLIIYCIQRLSSWRNLLKWKDVPLLFFYIIFFSEVVITA